MDIITQRMDGDRVLLITLNRPEKLNALNHSLLTDLSEVLSQIKHDPSVQGVLITGSGKAFCAGADIQALASCDAIKGYEFARFGQRVFMDLERLGKPSIALINGAALGGGCELIQATTLRLASKVAKFGQPEVKLGVIPGYGGTQRLARFIGKGRALDLCLTGRMIDAETACQWGLVSAVYEADDLLTQGLEWMRSLLALAPCALTEVMNVIHHGYELSLAEALELEALAFAKVCSTQDKQEGVEAFLAKRPAHFQGR